MIKNCRVLINNEAVTVIDYDGVKVQIPAINRIAKSVNVIAENGIYSVINDDYVENDILTDEQNTAQSKSKKKTTRTKKTTLDENVINYTSTDGEN